MSSEPIVCHVDQPVEERLATMHTAQQSHPFGARSVEVSTHLEDSADCPFPKN